MNSRRMITVGRFAAASLALLFAASVVLAQTQTAPEVLRVVKGKSLVVTFPERIKTISIADEKVIDVVSMTPTEAVVIGKEEGTTTLVMWGESGKHRAYETRVDRAVRSQQVLLEVQIAEVNKQKLSELGTDWLYRNTDNRHIAAGEKTIGSYTGGVTIPDPNSQNIFAQEGISGVIKWIGPKQTVQVALNALEDDGVLKMLANPKLVCLSQDSASFLVGGEIPVPIASQAQVGQSTVMIQWKEYGVKLRFLPTIVDSNLVRVKIAPEVSSLDYTNAVTFAGWTIPAMRTRKAAATVELNSSQSIVLGGLNATESIESVRRVPILGHIPILNFFFSKKSKSKIDTELLIVVSPRVIESVAQETIPPLPGTTEENK